MSPESSLFFRGFDLNTVKGLVESEFTVEDVRIEMDILTFQVKIDRNSKFVFERLVDKLKIYNLLPFMRKRNGFVFIDIAPKPLPRLGRLRTNVILLIATLGTVFASGYFNSVAWVRIFGGSHIIEALYFTACLMAIVGLHEIGHKIIAQRRKLESTLPYFIPGPPFPIGFGTFGAVILQREPPINRDHLFDLGFSGPVTGFIITLFVTVAAITGSKMVDPALLEKYGIQLINIQPSLAWILLQQLLRPGETGVIIPPIGWAAWLGFVITYLNLLPIWQLDGGHIAKALFGDRGYKFATAIGLVVTFVTGFWFFGLLILFFSFQGKGSVILDNVSSLSKKRVALGILAYIILIFSAVIIPFM